MGQPLRKSHSSREQLSDQELMGLVKGGQTHCLGSLYERNKGRLFGFFFRLYQDAALSEDLVQGVFMRMLKYRHTFQEASDFKVWMFHLARNVSHDHFRKHKHRIRQQDIADYQEQLADESRNVDEQMQRQEQNEQLHHAIEKLSPDRKEALILSRFEGMKYKDIAMVMQTTESNIKIKVHRAMQDLKGLLLSPNR